MLCQSSYYCLVLWVAIPGLLTALGEGMVGDGYKDVVNIDISSVVIEAMQKKYQEHPELKCILYII